MYCWTSLSHTTLAKSTNLDESIDQDKIISSEEILKSFFGSEIPIIFSEEPWHVLDEGAVRRKNVGFTTTTATNLFYSLK